MRETEGWSAEVSDWYKCGHKLGDLVRYRGIPKTLGIIVCEGQGIFKDRCKVQWIQVGVRPVNLIGVSPGCVQNELYRSLEPFQEIS